MTYIKDFAHKYDITVQLHLLSAELGKVFMHGMILSTHTARLVLDSADRTNTSTIATVEAVLGDTAREEGHVAGII